MLNLIKPFNLILAADSYKAGHWQELPENVGYTYSVIVPRKASKYSDKIVAMGQTYVAEIMSKIRIDFAMIDEAEKEITEQGYTFNRRGWEIIASELDGKLPLAIYGVEEGRVIDPQTPLLGIFNTDPRFPWLPAYVETIVQCIVWKMSTVASICRACRITIAKYMELTGADMTGLNYKLHNFGDRGADSPEEAAVLAGIAHGALFDGSDCMRANGYIKAMYRTNKAYLSSVEATEHSVMCANSDASKLDDFGAMDMAIERLYDVVERAKKGTGIPLMSVVIDTYDSRRFVRVYAGGLFRDKILASGGKMVFRPDSGDPRVEPAKVAHDVELTFGATVNQKGYKVLHPSTGVLQGDGNRIDTFEGILKGWTDAGFSMDSFVLGMGSGVSHDGARDDFSFSMKAVAMFQSIDDGNGGGQWVRLLKRPLTDLKKMSLSGLVRNTEVDGDLIVEDVMAVEGQGLDGLRKEGSGWKLWYQDGERKNFQTFDEVRERARA